MSQTGFILEKLRNVFAGGKVISNRLIFDVGKPYFLVMIYIDRVHSGRYYVGCNIVPWYGLARPDQGRAFGTAYGNRVRGAARTFTTDKSNQHAVHEIAAAIIEQKLLPDLSAVYGPREFLANYFPDPPERYVQAFRLADYMITAFLAGEEGVSYRCADLLCQFDASLPIHAHPVEVARSFIGNLRKNNDFLLRLINDRVVNYKKLANFT